MTRALGIDFGNHSIKIAELEFSSRQRQIIGLYEVKPKENQTKSEALREFFANNSIKAERVSIGINNADVMMRKFDLPFRDRKKMNLAIIGEWMDSVPFELDDFYIETRHISKHGKIHSFISGICPKSSIAELNAECENAWIQPNNVLIDAEAIASLALEQSLPKAHDRQAYAVVDFGYEITKIAIVRGAVLEKKQIGITPEIIELRHLDKGSKEWIEWIAQKRKVSVEEALGWLMHRAEIQSDASDGEEASIREDLSDDIKSALRPILVELYQTLQHARVQSGYEVQGLYITGSMCGIVGLKPFLEKELRVEVDEWPLFLGFKAHGALTSIENQKSFATALSLAYSYASQVKTPWLNFKKSTSPNRYILSDSLKLFTSPDLKPALFFAAFLLVFSWGISIAGQQLLSIEQEAVELDLSGEFRKLDKVTGAKAKNFVGDPERAREIYIKSKRGKQPKSLEEFDTGPIPQVALLDQFSDAAAPELKVDEYEVIGQNDLWQIKLTISPKETSSDFAQGSTSFVRQLESLGYTNVKLTPVTPGSSSTLEATWKAPQAEGAAR
ncbi:hypothetical protein GW916_06580 [bacterium]|nr:hypothetical protein [bacterium]